MALTYRPAEIDHTIAKIGVYHNKNYKLQAMFKNSHAYKTFENLFAEWELPERKVEKNKAYWTVETNKMKPAAIEYLFKCVVCLTNYRFPKESSPARPTIMGHRVGMNTPRVFTPTRDGFKLETLKSAIEHLANNGYINWFHARTEMRLASQESVFFLTPKMEQLMLEASKAFDFHDIANQLEANKPLIVYKDQDKKVVHHVDAYNEHLASEKEQAILAKLKIMNSQFGKNRILLPVPAFEEYVNQIATSGQALTEVLFEDNFWTFLTHTLGRETAISVNKAIGMPQFFQGNPARLLEFTQVYVGSCAVDPERIYKETTKEFTGNHKDEYAHQHFGALKRITKETLEGKGEGATSAFCGVGEEEGTGTRTGTGTGMGMETGMGMGMGMGMGEGVGEASAFCPNKEEEGSGTGKEKEEGKETARRKEGKGEGVTSAFCGKREEEGTGTGKDTGKGGGEGATSAFCTSGERFTEGFVKAMHRLLVGYIGDRVLQHGTETTMIDGEAFIDFTNLMQYRAVFNELPREQKHESGGRNYCDLQSIPSKLRKQLVTFLHSEQRICKNIEWDVKGEHIAMLLRLDGCSLSGDELAAKIESLYQFEGIELERSVAKPLILALLNLKVKESKNLSAGMRGLAIQAGLITRKDACKDLLDKMKRHPLAGWFGSGIGIKLQAYGGRIDRLLIEKIAQNGLDLPVISIHDGFSMPDIKAAERFVTLYKEAFKEVMDAVTGNQIEFDPVLVCQRLGHSQEVVKSSAILTKIGDRRSTRVRKVVFMTFAAALEYAETHNFSTWHAALMHKKMCIERKPAARRRKKIKRVYFQSNESSEDTLMMM